MQFPTEESADRAAREIEQSDFDIAPDRNTSVNLPAYPTAHSHRRPDVPTIGSTITHGKFVIDIFAGLPISDEKSLTELVSNAYRAQIRLLDTLPTLTPEDVVRLPPDPDGMLNRTINPDSNTYLPDDQTYIHFGMRGYLIRSSDSELSKTKISDSGADRVSYKKESPDRETWLYRTRNIDTASTLRSTILAETHPQTVEPPPVVPGAVCGESTDVGKQRFRCAISYRRYVSTVEGDQIQDVHQLAAAEYALLANNQ